MKMSNWKWILVAIALAAVIPATALAQSEGIKVHGRWVIEVRNPDGSVAQHREFNNSLHSGGTHFWGGTSLPSPSEPRSWGMGFLGEVLVYDSPNQSLSCLWRDASPPECEIVDRRYLVHRNERLFKTLSVSRNRGPISTNWSSDQGKSRQG